MLFWLLIFHFQKKKNKYLEYGNYIFKNNFYIITNLKINIPIVVIQGIWLSIFDEFVNKEYGKKVIDDLMHTKHESY